jgi:lipid II:glycine glycyltransferase (peptidoglycan interpeptide bridge formation enzyme)
VTLRVRPVSVEAVSDFLSRRDDAAHQQWPSWGLVKSEWQHALIGWFDGDEIVGTGLVLSRRLRPTPWSFDYLPEGPVIDWDRYAASDVIEPLVQHLRQSGSAVVKIGARLPLRRWTGQTLMTSMTQSPSRWRDVTPDIDYATVQQLHDSLRAMGARPYEAPGAGFGGTMQPRYGVEVPLLGRTITDLQTAASSSFLRNVRKAERAGVTVRIGDVNDIGRFHSMLAQSGERDGFTPRGEEYFAHMMNAMNAEDPRRVRLYLAEHDGETRAAALRVTVGDVSSYTYGGSSPAGHAERASNALQWRMLTDALEEGCSVHDLRGVSDTLDPKDPLWGLTRFKLAMGGEAVEYSGEWDIASRPMIARVLSAYLTRRLQT